MKRIFLFSVILIHFHAQGQDFRIRINDSTFNVSLDKVYEIPVNGKMTKFSISAQDTLKYDDELFSFLYSKDFKVSKNRIDSGIEQIAILTAEGSGIIIQKYSSFDPTSLNEIMLNELTKRSLSYGYVEKRDDYDRKLKSGQEIRVDKAVLTYKNETDRYEVASIGKKDEGVIIVTMLLGDISPQGQKVVKLLWDSLIVK